MYPSRLASSPATDMQLGRLCEERMPRANKQKWNAYSFWAGSVGWAGQFANPGPSEQIGKLVDDQKGTGDIIVAEIFAPGNQDGNAGGGGGL